MSNSESTGMTRRDLLRRGTAAGIAVGGVGYGSLRLDAGPVQETEAIAPAVAAGAALVAGSGGASLGWALREYEVIGSDEPPEGVTADSLESEVYTVFRNRKSTNASTIVDNQNIVDGIDHSAWADGKIAAIEALNEQKSQSDVLDDGTEKVNDYEDTIIENYLSTWNEAVDELITYAEAVKSHSDLSYSSVFGYDSSWSMTTNTTGDTTNIEELKELWSNTKTYTTESGKEIEYKQIEGEWNASVNRNGGWDPVGGKFGDWASSSDLRIIIKAESGLDYLHLNDWEPMFSDIEQTFSDVRGGLGDWVDSVYGEVQAGDLETDELLTPREQAELTSDDEDFPQALADLEALNVSVDYEREAEIRLLDIGATLYGRLGYTGDTTLETGEYDPEADLDGTVYLTYDVSEGSGDWDEFEDGIDGGVVTFTKEPFQETEYQIETAAGETATVVYDDFEENDDGDEWTVDISEQVEDSITEVEAATFYAESEDGETNYETIQLRDPFEIKRYTDQEDKEYEESNFERSEPQNDENYISEEEWKEQQERHDELIEKYEESQENEVALPGVDEVLAGEANGFIGIAVVGFVLVSAILSALNPFS